MTLPEIKLDKISGVAGVGGALLLIGPAVADFGGMGGVWIALILGILALGATYKPFLRPAPKDPYLLVTVGVLSILAPWVMAVGASTPAILIFSLAGAILAGVGAWRLKTRDGGSDRAGTSAAT